MPVGSRLAQIFLENGNILPVGFWKMDFGKWKMKKDFPQIGENNGKWKSDFYQKILSVGWLKNFWKMENKHFPLVGFWKTENENGKRKMKFENSKFN